MSCPEAGSEGMPFLESLSDLKVASHTPDGKVEIDMGISGLLGCGAHGVVRVGRVLATGERVAVKVSPIARSAKSSLKELTVLTMLPTHTHLVRIYSAQVNVVDGMLYLVLELCAGGELFDRIAEAGGMPEPEARRCFMQILSAIVHCHSAGVYHRDLKPENILLDVHDNVKVADFGLASTRDREASSAAHLQHTAVGSLSYAAPELHNGADGGETGYDPEKADIWSLGVVLYCMLTARLPFQLAHALLDERYAAVVREGIQLMCPESLSAEAVSLLGLLLHPNPTARPSARELMDHAWLEGVERPEAAPDTACVADAPSPVSSPLPAPPKWSEYATRVQLPDGSSQPRLQTNPAQQQRSLKRGGCASSAELDGAAAHSAERARGLQPSDTWELLGQACTAGAGESGKRLRTSADPAAAGGTVADATQRRAASGGDQQVGVPDLVRHLGWERLDGSAVELMANVLKALDELGIAYTLDKSTSSVRLPPTAALSADDDGSNAATELADVGNEGELETRVAEVTIRLVQSATSTAGRETVDLNFIRTRGSTIAFHSIYKAFRGQMAEVNGWSEATQQYEVAVP